MSPPRRFVVICICAFPFAAGAQDTIRTLPTVTIRATEALHVLGHEPQLKNGVLYAGKKTEVLVLDSVHANMARDVQRQILGRIPGASFSETQGAGFPSNGVGFRGLDPTQSVEMNVRQDGVNIAADVYGYPEAYVTPPTESLERIEFVRGAGALAFGPQVGGTINYVMRRGEFGLAPRYDVRQTAGSFGFVNSFNAVRGGTSRIAYYGFASLRREQGARPNSDYAQNTTYGQVAYRASERLVVSADVTRFRNRVHMPGGLSDAQFAADPNASYRARNWLASPWNVAALRASYTPTSSVRLNNVLSYMGSSRYLVWRNEDGGPDAVDSMSVPREVESETFQNWMLESRMSVNHAIFARPATVASGLRLGWNRLHRFEGGPGFGGADFNMNLAGAWERALRFTTYNVAVFAEELVQLTQRLSVQAGARVEDLRSFASGYTDVTSSFVPRAYRYPLFGAGAEYLTSGTTQLYGNVSQSYRPVLYANLAPLGSVTQVDSNLSPSRAVTAEAGWRGVIGDRLKFDVGAFQLWYRNRLGVRQDAAGVRTISGNIGNSVHRGAEAYAEVDPFRRVSVFTSLAYIDARYVTGEYSGKRVELAPRVLARGGLSFDVGPLASTLQVSHTSDSFGDASNARVPSDDAVAGYIPAYTILDWGGSVNLGRALLDVGINNVANARYFTKRTGEYPGPGILPGLPRSAYIGIRLQP